MNSFVIEKLSEFTYKKVKYYSIRYVESNSDEYIENDVNEFYDFLNRMEDIPEVSEDLSNLLVWIEVIGKIHGAREKFFRYEGIYADTSALPPPRPVMSTRKIVVNGIRLYCFVANEHVVFLFNGDIKTENIIDAKYCPKVGPYIKKANAITKKLNELFQRNEISWQTNYTDINFDNTQEHQL